MAAFVSGYWVVLGNDESGEFQSLFVSEQDGSDGITNTVKSLLQHHIWCSGDYIKVREGQSESVDFVDPMDDFNYVGSRHHY